MTERPTVIVYVDGFNLYKSKLEKRGDLKWLNLESLFDQILPEYSVVKILFFTARLKGKANPEDPSAPDRQSAYLRALSTLPRVEVHTSNFSVMPGRARLFQKEVPEPPSTWLPVWKVQEKGSDVKLAIQLVLDSIDQLADCLVVVSNDSDLARAIEVATLRFGTKVGVIHPKDSRSTTFAQYPLEFTRFIRISELASSQLSRVVQTSQHHIVRPDRWK
jgi:hypothetical protein